MKYAVPINPLKPAFKVDVGYSIPLLEHAHCLVDLSSDYDQARNRIELAGDPMLLPQHASFTSSSTAPLYAEHERMIALHLLQAIALDFDPRLVLHAAHGKTSKSGLSGLPLSNEQIEAARAHIDAAYMQTGAAQYLGLTAQTKVMIHAIQKEIDAGGADAYLCMPAWVELKGSDYPPSAWEFATRLLHKLACQQYEVIDAILDKFSDTYTLEDAPLTAQQSDAIIAASGSAASAKPTVKGQNTPRDTDLELCAECGVAPYLHKTEHDRHRVECANCTMDPDLYVDPWEAVRHWNRQQREIANE